MSMRCSAFPREGTVAFLHVFSKAGPQGGRGAGRPQIYLGLFMVAGRVPLFRETLVKGLGTIFSSHTCQRPFNIQASMSPHARHAEKRRGHGTHREGEKKREPVQEQQLQHVSPEEYLHDQCAQLVIQKKAQLLHEMS